MLDLPADHPTRREVAPLIQLVSEAWRIATVNKALGTNLTSLDTLPVDFVSAVLIWGTPDA